MKTPTSSPNLKGLVVALIGMILVTVSCARIKQFVQPNKQSDAVNEFNYSVPFGLKNTEEIHQPGSSSPLAILIPASGRIHLTSVESPPVNLQALSESIRSYVDGKTEYEKAVFITAGSDVDASALNGVLNELRKHEIDRVSLMISSVERRKDQYGNEGRYERSMGDIPAPDRSFEVQIRSREFARMPAENGVPNPLTLRVRLYPDGRLDLNNHICKDENELVSKLKEVFDLRESNGVFRESSNEIEKTVLFQIDHDGRNPTGTHKYGDLARVIDALKAAVAQPIVLIDSTGEWMPPAPPGRPQLVADSTPSPGSKVVPSTISGGVLNGKATSLPKPPYPPAARAVRATGAVTVQVTVDEDGNVTQAKAVSGHPLLRAASEQAARGAKFSPTMLSGQRVKVSGVLIYNFAPPE